ncbi:MAG: short-chain dehydrogenase [Candidatus Melainabacteria bacterium HGW-Melainabacteria-1]|nr:MAG: short-chain dehydrogenase [Candidatus Melainabacteria bacterium HGW-Melainabacteria-1]
MPKQIFISGASKGIGLAIAERFLAGGFEVAISASTEASLAAVRASHPQIRGFRADMAVKAEVLALAAWIETELGPLDVLVNNVGRFSPGAIHSESDEAFEMMMNTNVFSNYYLSKRLLPAMMARKSGTVFNICSIASIMAYANGGAYSISKHALLGFSKVLREEMKPHGIRVVSVLPGATLTASWAGVDLPPERFMPAEDVAAVVWDTYQLSPRTVVEEILLRPQLGDL